MEYYENREEYEYVGFIDKEISRRKNKSIDEIKDVFKLREKRAKILEKKREKLEFQHSKELSVLQQKVKNI